MVVVVVEPCPVVEQPVTVDVEVSQVVVAVADVPDATVVMTLQVTKGSLMVVLSVQDELEELDVVVEVGVVVGVVVGSVGFETVGFPSESIVTGGRVLRDGTGGHTKVPGKGGKSSSSIPPPPQKKQPHRIGMIVL